MPGHLQEGFGCVVTNRFDQLLDDESDPFEILKAAENKKKEGAAAGSTKTAAQAAKQPKKESQKDRKNPLLDKKEESQAPVPLKKEGKSFTAYFYSVLSVFIFVFYRINCHVQCPLAPLAAERQTQHEVKLTPRLAAPTQDSPSCREPR